mmetsp:Transcript_16916/g.39870  ORF Transcript_16916/g.39870 Transcript_16916/m.39870 type:complete len:96 (+) Transcript_16916:478-765(+)
MQPQLHQKQAGNARGCTQLQLDPCAQVHGCFLACWQEGWLGLCMMATYAAPFAKANQKRLSSESGRHIHPKADVGSCCGASPLHSWDALMLTESC